MFQARRDGLISPIFVGDVERIRSIARSQGENVPQEALVQAGGETECAQCAVDLIRQDRAEEVQGVIAVHIAGTHGCLSAQPQALADTGPLWDCVCNLHGRQTILIHSCKLR